MSELIKRLPEFSLEISGNLNVSHLENGFIELSLQNFNKAKLLKDKKLFNKEISLKQIESLLNKNIIFDTIINGSNYKLTIDSVKKENKIIKILAKETENKKVIIFRDLNKKSDIVLKALVPVVIDDKPCGPVKYSTRNPFNFNTFQSYALPNSDGVKTLRNKGAIFWYLADQKYYNNAILGVKYIMMNITTAAFTPVNCIIQTGNADIYYGWYNEDKAYPKQYIDFYIYQQPVNNYLYKFTVKESSFFSNPNFPDTKNVQIVTP